MGLEALVGKRKLFHAALFWPILVCGTGGFVTQGFSSSDSRAVSAQTGALGLGSAGLSDHTQKDLNRLLGDLGLVAL